MDQYNVLLFFNFILILFVIGFIIILRKGKKEDTLINNSDSKETNNNVTKSPYILKKFMTYNERKFYQILLNLEKTGNYKVHPQINLASIIDKNDGSRFYNELFRNVDFAIFDKDYQNLLLLIELNDESHSYSNRKARDIKVKSICESAGIKLITFYTKYPNEKDYVLNRIINEINNLKKEI